MSDLSSNDLARARAPLEVARSMPAGFYTSAEFFGRERKEIFQKHWFFAGRADELPNPGDYRAFDTVGGPAILIRSQSGELKAFANFCRHRGSILLEGEGNCRRIVCPYHAWSYMNDGTLYGCPDMEDAEGFDRVENGLVPIRMEMWAGFIFLTYNDAAPDLMTWLGDLPERMASHRPDEMRCTWKFEIDCACNWKLLLENAMETYHTGTVHRDSVGAQVSRTLPTHGEWLCIQVLSERSIGTLQDDAPTLPPIDGLDDDAKKGTYFTVVHPTCQWVFAQDCMWWLIVLPLGQVGSRLEVGGCFPKAVTERDDFAELAAPYCARWEQVAHEDVGILEKQQRALGSVHYRPGPLSGRDDQVQAIGLWVLDHLGEVGTD